MNFQFTPTTKQQPKKRFSPSNNGYTSPSKKQRLDAISNNDLSDLLQKAETCQQEVDYTH